MKKLFIYYSNTGNGDVIAIKLVEKGIEVRKVERKKPLPKSFFWMVMSGGFLAGTNHKDKLKDYDKDISSFDHIYIGSPIWNGRFSCPVNTLLRDLDLKDKKVTFILYSGSGEAPKAVKRINKEFPDSKIIILKDPKKYEEELVKLADLD